MPTLPEVAPRIVLPDSMYSAALIAPSVGAPLIKTVAAVPVYDPASVKLGSSKYAVVTLPDVPSGTVTVPESPTRNLAKAELAEPPLVTAGGLIQTKVPASAAAPNPKPPDRKTTRLNSSHS